MQKRLIQVKMPRELIRNRKLIVDKWLIQLIAPSTNFRELVIHRRRTTSREIDVNSKWVLGACPFRFQLPLTAKIETLVR